ncbi:MAG: hypothetical protein WC438_05355 [Candidatus Pacearchaeota archaeon]
MEYEKVSKYELAKDKEKNLVRKNPLALKSLDNQEFEMPAVCH